VRDKPLDKMRGPAPNKAVRPAHRRSSTLGDDGAEADDFSEIPGVPEFAVESLHNQGVLRFDQLWNADLRWLHGPVRAAIERWRNG